MRLVGAMALLLALPAAGAIAQDLSCEAGDREVQRLRFDGNAAFTDAELARAVVTTPSSAASRLRIVGTRRCLDPDEFPRDVIRLQTYYRARGWVEATVDTVVRALPVGARDRRAVDVTFVVREGRPLRVDRVVVTGVDSLRAAGGGGGARGAEAAVRARLLRDFPLREGSVFDRVALAAARDTIVGRLRNGGYPRADALVAWDTDTARMAASAQVTVLPGAFTRLGTIRLERDTAGGAEVPDATVRRTLGLRPGDPFRANAILDAQRALYETDAYRRVEIREDTAPAPGGAARPDTLLDLVVQLTEGELRAARVGAGWATLDCFRTQAEYTDRYFAHWAQRLELTGRVSRIGIGAPLGFAPALCPQARQDQYSDTLNYYLGATVRHSSLYRGRRIPSVTLFTSVASEYNAFRRRTTIGSLLSIASPAGARLPTTWSYQFELGRTDASPVVFCAIFSACDDTSRARLTADNRPLGAIGYTVARNRTNDPVDPTAGTSLRFSARHASAATLSHPTQRFNKLVGDATWYRRLGESNLLVAHVQVGAVFGGAPPQERLFAGGPTSVRGFRQNELGPVVYLVSEYEPIVNPFTRDTFLIADPDSVTVPDRTIPAGGNTLVVANLELQTRSPVLADLLRFAFFVDAGEVWNRGVATAQVRQLRLTPGAGVRVRTLFGVVRVDLGYNPYSPLTPTGPAYAIATGPAGEQALYCVSPLNDLPVTGFVSREPGSPLARQALGDCPAQFTPASPRGFLRRLNPSIWIGNAF